MHLYIRYVQGHTDLDEEAVAWAVARHGPSDLLLTSIDFIPNKPWDNLEINLITTQDEVGICGYPGATEDKDNDAHTKLANGEKHDQLLLRSKTGCHKSHLHTRISPLISSSPGHAPDQLPIGTTIFLAGAHLVLSWILMFAGGPVTPRVRIGVVLMSACREFALLACPSRVAALHPPQLRLPRPRLPRRSEMTRLILRLESEAPQEEHSRTKLMIL